MGDSDKLSDQQNDRLSTMLNVMLRFEPQISSLVSKIDTDAKLRSQLLNNKNDAVSKFQLILWRAKKPRRTPLANSLNKGYATH